ncbi:flagellin [Methanoculleus bourgensis MS2]|jgi:flagellin FlaB|uniref:Flagellin n=2 Tax=Methanoculleus bourgensis TaxID=83986 RepID=I7JA21_METBM|nr:archaellin/type IV pilin N-terminal domain-containing protein [Methanoculleus bourgensis]CCJ36938.1 flagellin [Methanoculleus bourgensis MS2]CVK33824.1 putative flagellin 1 [Methanoculleus bourgensis]
MDRDERDDRAFTGLEAAIVFIALIVVASVFAYVVVGAGIAASQKNQEVMHAALEESGSALRPGQVVIAKLDNNEGLLYSVEFDLETATNLAAVDMGGVIYTVATQETLVTFPPGDSHITLTWRCREDTNDLLEAGEVVTVKLVVNRMRIQRGETFTIGMTTAGGATASLTRTIPAGIGKNVFIELF